MHDDSSTGGGYSIFHETIADMTYPEVEQAVRDGAVALWGLGVIEEHGPHLPLGTDVYVPTAKLKRVRRILEGRGVRAVVIPPFYWGVNQTTRSFTGSIDVRPEIVVEVMVDVFKSLAKDGFRRAFCLSGHGEALHNTTIAEGVKKGRAASGIDAYVVLASALAKRLGLDVAEPHLAVFEHEPPRRPYVDVHAGDPETSMMWALYPGLVREEIIPTLPPTNLGPGDLATWRRGGVHAKATTPAGYLGDPASANRERGLTSVDAEAAKVAGAIMAKVGGGGA